MAAESLDVKSVVVSFAKSPLVAAARPLPTERESQDIFVQQTAKLFVFGDTEMVERAGTSSPPGVI